MWKTLSIVSGVALLAGGGIMFTMVRPALIAERTQVENAREYQTKANTRKSEADTAVKTADSELSAMKASLTKAESDRAAAAAKKEEISKKVEEAILAKDAASKELADLDQKLRDLGGLEAMVAELKAQEAKRIEYDRQISAAKSAIESALSQKAVMDRQITEIKRIDSWQQSGTMAPTFRSRVTAVNPDWGFVTIGAGNNASVVRQAKLDVIRGNSVVGKVVVTHVAPNSAAAEVVPGSVAPGDSILPGDQVRTGAGSLPSNQPRQAPAPSAPAAPASPGTSPSPAPEAPAPEDPFAPAAEGTPAETPADSPPAEAAPALEPAEADAPMAE